MRIVLVDPAPRCGIIEPYEHLGLGYLCAALRNNGYEAEILSAPLHNLSFRQLVRKIRQLRPDLLGFSLKEINARKVLGIIEELRHVGLKSHITLGGHFPTFNHRRILQDYPHINSIVRGEGEETLVDLAETLERGGPLSHVQGLTYRKWYRIIANPPRPLIEDLDRLPFSARDQTEEVVRQGGGIGISASRGCYANCSFCSIRSFYNASPGRKWRTRTPKNVVDEIEKLSVNFPQAHFTFIDDQFVGPGEKGKKYAQDIASQILQRGLSIQFILSCRADVIEEDMFSHLKKAGLIKVFLGIESGTQSGLDRFQKNTTVEQNKRALEILKTIGLGYTIAFIFFDPYTTIDEMKGNLEFLSHIHPYWQGRKGVLSIEPSLIIHKGTPVERRLKGEGRLQGNYIGYAYTIRDRRVQIIRIVADFLMRRVAHFYYQLTMKRRVFKKV